MKYLNKFLLMSAVAVAGLFTACTNDDYEPGASVDGMQIYFPNTIPSEYDVPDTQASVTVPVRRINTDEAVQVAILANEESGLFTIPSSVSFQAGSASADLVISFDRSALVDGTEYPISLLLTDQENTTPYGNYMVDFSIVPWPWKELGTGKFREGWLSDVFKDCNIPEINVTIHEHVSKPNVYLVEEMFGWTYMSEVLGATQDELAAQFSYTPTNIKIDCSDPSNVKIENQFTGITENGNGYGEFFIASSAPGTFKDGVITFPAGGLEAYLMGYSPDPFPTNSGGTFRVILPGAEATDYTLVAEYGGMRVGSDNTKANLVLNFTYGADVTGISFVVAQGNVESSAADIAAKIADGTAENINKVENFEVGGKTVSVETPLAQSGVYTVVAVPSDKSGKLLPDAMSAAMFYFPGLGGGDVPECDITVMMGLVSEYWPEKSAQCPDESSLFFQIEGSDLKSLSTMLAATSDVEAVIKGGETYESLIDAYGTDHSADFMPYINEKGYYGSAWIQLDEGTSYTMIVKATNIYGKSKTVHAEYATTALSYPDYTGELAIGKYYMHNEIQGELIENYFTVAPVSGSTNKFTVKDLGMSGVPVAWNATYDSSTHKFTLDGTAVGLEDKGNLFGGLIGYWNAEETQMFGYYIFASETSQGDDPCVFSVDPSTKQISSLDVELDIPVVDITNNELLGYAVAFLPGSSVSLSVSYQQVSKPATIHKVQVPFSSVLVPNTSTSVLCNRYAGKTCGEAVQFAPGVRTLDITTKKCEPLPKQFSGLKIKDSARGGLK